MRLVLAGTPSTENPVMPLYPLDTGAWPSWRWTGTWCTRGRGAASAARRIQAAETRTTAAGSTVGRLVTHISTGATSCLSFATDWPPRMQPQLRRLRGVLRGYAYAEGEGKPFYGSVV
jgi:hypothetical protein